MNQSPYDSGATSANMDTDLEILKEYKLNKSLLYTQISIVYDKVVIFDGSSEMAKKLGLIQEGDDWYAHKKSYTPRKGYKFKVEKGDVLQYVDNKYNKAGWYITTRERNKTQFHASNTPETVLLPSLQFKEFMKKHKH